MKFINSEESMELVRKDIPGKSLIKVSGRLTATRLNESLRGMVKEIIADDITMIIIDMSELIHMDSTGVGELVSAYTAVKKEKGTLYLYGVGSTVKELLETTNLLDIFTLLSENSPEYNEFKA